MKSKYRSCSEHKSFKESCGTCQKDMHYNSRIALIATITRGWDKATKKTRVAVLRKWGPTYEMTNEEIERYINEVA